MGKASEPIFVTKTFLPPKEEFLGYFEKIWGSHWLTNQGPLLREFEEKAKAFLGLDNFHFVTNGTVALQVAMRAMGVTEGEVITTPFSYVATASAILWERCDPVFVDIDPKTLCIDPDKIEAAITSRTRAILPVHVFGNPCDVDKIEAIAKKHHLKVIYDGAHAFGVQYKGKSVLSYGDAAICSFHATKLFHTIEGGAIILRERLVHEAAELIKRFGHHGDEHHMLGINAKASEFQAAMGLCNLGHIDRIIKERSEITKKYDTLLKGKVGRVELGANVLYNYAYYPVIFESEQRLLDVIDHLAKMNIFPRRYFYPSLNMLPYLKKYHACPVSEDISRRIMCLPLYVGLEDKTVQSICGAITK